MARLALVLLAMVGCGPAAPPHDTLGVAHRFSQAWADDDLATLEPLLRDDYLHTDVAGNVLDKPQWLAYMRDRRAKGIRNVIRFSDEKVRFYGDVAVITEQDEIETAGDSSSSFRMRSTQVWIHDGHAWRRAAFEGTPIAPPKP